MHDYFAARSGRRLAWLCSLFVLAAPAAHAGPEEDYQTGYKTFRDGDVVGSMTPLRSAANAGHAKAQVLLAEILDRSEFDEDARELYRKAAEQGDPDGMFGLGAMLASGEGGTKKDAAAGRQWIEKAAELGHRQATNVMAQAHLKIELDLVEADRDTPRAFRWVKLAAENDYLPALDALVAAYTAGNIWGLSPDKATAERYQAQANRIRNIETAKAKKKPRRVE